MREEVFEPQVGVPSSFFPWLDDVVGKTITRVLATKVPTYSMERFERRFLLLRETFQGSGAALSFDFDNVADQNYRIHWMNIKNEDTATRVWTLTHVVGLTPASEQEVVLARQEFGPTASGNIVSANTMFVYVNVTALGRNNAAPFDLIGAKPDGSRPDRFQLDVPAVTAADTVTCTALLERIPAPALWSAPPTPFSAS